MRKVAISHVLDCTTWRVSSFSKKSFSLVLGFETFFFCFGVYEEYTESYIFSFVFKFEGLSSLELKVVRLRGRGVHLVLGGVPLTEPLHILGKDVTAAVLEEREALPGERLKVGEVTVIGRGLNDGRGLRRLGLRGLRGLLGGLLLVGQLRTGLTLLLGLCVRDGLIGDDGRSCTGRAVRRLGLLGLLVTPLGDHLANRGGVSEPVTVGRDDLLVTRRGHEVGVLELRGSLRHSLGVHLLAILNLPCEDRANPRRELDPVVGLLLGGVRVTLLLGTLSLRGLCVRGGGRNDLREVNLAREGVAYRVHKESAELVLGHGNDHRGRHFRLKVL